VSKRHMRAGMEQEARLTYLRSNVQPAIAA
jgi:hypothetical protein